MSNSQVLNFCVARLLKTRDIIRHSRISGMTEQETSSMLWDSSLPHEASTVLRFAMKLAKTNQ